MTTITSPIVLIIILVIEGIMIIKAKWDKNDKKNGKSQK